MAQERTATLSYAMGLANFVVRHFSPSLNSPFRSGEGKGKRGHLAIGELGEKIARAYLRAEGRKILYRNFRAPRGGEVDIVARDGETLSFVEVKTRQYEKYRNTLPEENITYAKLRKLSKIAGAYLRLKRLEDAPYRFDAVSVWLSAGNEKTRVKHIKSL